MKWRLTVSSYVTNFAMEEYERVYFFVKREYLRVGGWISETSPPPGAKRCLVPKPNSAANVYPSVAKI